MSCLVVGLVSQGSVRCHGDVAEACLDVEEGVAVADGHLSGAAAGHPGLGGVVVGEGQLAEVGTGADLDAGAALEAALISASSGRSRRIRTVSWVGRHLRPPRWLVVQPNRLSHGAPGRGGGGGGDGRCGGAGGVGRLLRPPWAKTKPGTAMPSHSFPMTRVSPSRRAT